jgi:hypothetical protein
MVIVFWPTAVVVVVTLELHTRQSLTRIVTLGLSGVVDSLRSQVTLPIMGGVGSYGTTNTSVAMAAPKIYNRYNVLFQCLCSVLFFQLNVGSVMHGWLSLLWAVLGAMGPPTLPVLSQHPRLTIGTLNS